jgi:hypothetical protein
MNEQDLLNFVTDYRKRAASKFSNPYVFGVLALWYAYRGKLGSIERVLVGVAGAVTLYTNYQAISLAKKDAGVVDYLEKYAKGVVGDSIPNLDLKSLINSTDQTKTGV